MNPTRPVTFGVAAVLSAMLTSAPAAAAPAPATVWTLTLEGGEKQCRLTLRPEAGSHGAAVAMPPGCHHAFPALTGVIAWSEVGDALHFDDARGDTLLAFDPDGNGFRTTSPQGDRLVLTSADGKGRAGLDREAAALPKSEAPTPSAGGKPAARKASTAAEKPAEVAGRYAVLREKTRDTGCMVTLDDKERGPGKSLKARLAPACRDQGIVIFDPVGWQLEAGKLVLTARKGHTTALDPQEDGTWANDPKKGKTLALKRI